MLNRARRTFGQLAIVRLRLFAFLACASDGATTEMKMTLPFADVAERLFSVAVRHGNC